MIEEIVKAFSLVLLPSAIKFIFGPLAGKAAGLHIITTMVATAAGMMASVLAFTYFGEFMRFRILAYFNKKNPDGHSKNRKNATFWKKYGLVGISLLTPVILTPIKKTILAVSVSPKKGRILLSMLVSACVWSVIITSAVYFGYDAIIVLIKKIQPV